MYHTYRIQTKNGTEMTLIKNGRRFYIKDTYGFSTMVIIHRQEDIILAPITKCYVQTC